MDMADTILEVLSYASQGITKDALKPFRAQSDVIF